MSDNQEPYSLDDIDENEKIGVLNQPDSALGVETLKMLEGVGAPEKKLVLSPELQRAKVISLSNDEAAKIGRYTAKKINDIGCHMDSVSTFPKYQHPVFIEYDHAARFEGLEDNDAPDEGVGVPNKVGLLVFRDPEDSRLMNMFVVWNDGLGGLYHSYAIIVVDEEKLDIISSKRHMRGAFREDNIPDIIDAATVIVPERFKDEMFTLHDMDAVNDPRRAQAIQETQQRALAEYPFMLSTMIYLSSKDRSNLDFGLSNPFRPSIRSALKSCYRKLSHIFEKNTEQESETSKPDLVTETNNKKIIDNLNPKFKFESELGVSRTPLADQTRSELMEAQQKSQEEILEVKE